VVQQARATKKKQAKHEEEGNACAAEDDYNLG